MSKGAPDYSKLVLLQALDAAGNLIPVLLDSSGKIISVLQGLDPSAVLKTLKVDANGQIIAVIKGSGGEDIAVDASGYLTTILKAWDGSALRSVKCDSSGQIISLIKGSAGESIAVDASGNLSAAMKGLDGATLRTVAVDGSGNIIGVMKGDYGGTLKTIAVDSDGRMLGKIFDLLDVWGQNPNIGLAELASRFQTPPRYEKRGETVWYDDFESPILKWRSVTSGTGAAIVLNTTRAHLGERCLKLTAGTTDSMQAYVERVEDYYGSHKIGLEVSASWNEAPAGAVLRLRLTTRRTGTRYYGEIKIDPNAGKVYYYNSAGGWTEVGDLGLITTDLYAWYRFKYVVDFSTGKYVRCMFFNTEYDISTADMYSVAEVGGADMLMRIVYDGIASANKTVYVDDVILTAKEP